MRFPNSRVKMKLFSQGIPEQSTGAYEADGSPVENTVWMTIVVLVPLLSFLIRGAIPYLLVLASIALIANRPSTFLAGLSRTRPLVYVLAAFVAYAFTSRFYGVDPSRATTLAFHFALGLLGWVLLSGSNLSVAQTVRIVKVGLVCVSCWFFVYLFDAGLDHAIAEKYTEFLGQDYHFFLFNRPLTFTSLIALPLLAAAPVRRFWRAAVFFLILVVLFSSETESGMVSVVGAVIAALLTLAFRARFVALAGAVFCAMVLLGPLIVSALPIDSPEFMSKVPHRNLQARVYFWDHAARFTSESPVLGHGGEASRYFSHFPKLEHQLFAANGDVETIWMHPIGMHPHNGIMQTWLEYGAIGALLACLSLVLVCRHIIDSGSSYIMMWRMALFSAVFLMMNAAYGAWQTDWIAVIIFAAALMQKVERALVARDI